MAVAGFVTVANVNCKPVPADITVLHPLAVIFRATVSIEQDTPVTLSTFVQVTGFVTVIAFGYTTSITPAEGISFAGAKLKE